MKYLALVLLLSFVACQKNPIHINRGSGVAVGSPETERPWQSPQGILDPTFGEAGISYVGTSSNPALRTFYRDVQGNFLVGGNWANDFSAFKLKSNGRLDSGFGTNGKISYQFPTSATVDLGKGALQLAEGGYLVYGNTRSESGTDYDFGFAKLNADGSLDTAFGTGGTARTGFDVDTNEHLYEVVPTENNAFYGIGTGYIGGQYKTIVSRYKADGSLDRSFNVSGKLITSMGAVDSVRAGGMNRNGELVVVGHISYMIMLRRIKPSGIVAATSILPATEGAIAMAMAQDSQGRTVVAGLSHYGTHWIVTRFTEVGLLDGSFGQDGVLEIPAGPESSGFFPGVYCIQIQPDGKILIAGVLEKTQGAPTLGLARLDENGALDTTFGSNGFVSVEYQGAALVLTGMQLAASGEIYLLGNVKRGANSGFIIAKVK